MQHDFQYVSKKEAKELKKVLRDIIHEVQDEVRDKFTFQYQFVGSASRNMITYDTKSNIGFDFDVNFHVNDDDEEYTPREIKNIFRNALDRVVWKYGYKYCEDSTRVLTIKRVNTWNSHIEYSCDFAIVYNYGDGKQQYIRYDKERQEYDWVEQSREYYKLPEKMKWLKEHSLWNKLRDYYREKKNMNKDSDKKSRAIFAESVNEMCQKHGCKNISRKNNRR